MINMAKSNVPKMSADEMRWQAEDDARILRRAEEVRRDPSRVKRAGDVIQKELEALQSIANVAGVKVTSKVSSPKKSTAKATAKAPNKSKKK